MIGDYRELIEELLMGLNEDNYTIAVACASLPDEVRGFGPVKTEAIKAYRQRRAAYLHRFHNPASVVQIQEIA